MLEGASDRRPPQLFQVFFELKATRLAGSMLCWLGRSPPTPRSTRGCRCKGRGGLTQHVAAARCTVSIQILSAVRICLVYPRMSALGLGFNRSTQQRFDIALLVSRSLASSEAVHSTSEPLHRVRLGIRQTD